MSDPLKAAPDPGDSHWRHVQRAAGSGSVAGSSKERFGVSGPGGLPAPRRQTRTGGCFRWESFVLLTLLAVSLVTLPLVLPPLPPPPLTLLLLPIAILALLMLLALMPRDTGGLGYGCL